MPDDNTVSWAKAISEVKPELIRWLLNYFGTSLVLGVVAFLLWSAFTVQIDARVASLDARIEHLEGEVNHYRTMQAEEQKQRSTLFAAIEDHLRRLAH